MKWHINYGRADDQCEICLAPNAGRHERYAGEERYTICAPCSREVDEEAEATPENREVILVWRERFADLRHYEAGGNVRNPVRVVSEKAKAVLSIVRPIMARKIAEAKAARAAAEEAK